MLLFGLWTAISLVTRAATIQIVSPKDRPCFQRRAACSILAGSILLVVTKADALQKEHVWQIANGEVRLSDPLIIGNRKLSRPRLLGSGGGGAVFAFEGETAVVKVSWVGSRASVERECQVLQVLEQNSVQGVERCLAQVPYSDNRVMLLLEPLIDNAVANVQGIDTSLQPHAVRNIMRTMVQMLAANVVTIDVQPLISLDTGDVLFIDLTEAQALSKPFSFLDLTLISSFCAEVLALIPESLVPVASTFFLQELQKVESLRGARLDDPIYEILREQSILMSRDAIEYMAGAYDKN